MPGFRRVFSRRELKERYGSMAAPMSPPILLWAKYCLLIISAEISREKQTGSSLVFNNKIITTALLASLTAFHWFS